MTPFPVHVLYAKISDTVEGNDEDTVVQSQAITKDQFQKEA